MKKIFLILSIFIPVIVFGQAQTIYKVTSIANMKSYAGTAQRIHVTATNEDYVNCPGCTPDEVLIFDGAGTRNWKRVFDPLYFSSTYFNGVGTVGDPIVPDIDATPTNGSNLPVTSNAVFDELALKQGLDADLTTIAGLTATTDNFIVSVSGAWASRTPVQVKTTLALNNLDNTSDANKPVSTAQQTALDLKANLASPTFTGTPAAPTAAVGTNTTQLATTEFVNQNAYFTLMNAHDIQGIGDVTTYYFGWPGDLPLTGVANVRRQVIPIDCTLVAWAITSFNSSGTPTQQDMTVSIRINNTTDVLLSNTVQFTANNTTSNTYFGTLSTNFTAGDTFETKLVTPTFTTDPTASCLVVTYYFNPR